MIQKEEAEKMREQFKSDVVASIKTPDGKGEEKKKAKSVEYEFMGPIGTFMLIFLLPLTVYYVNMACRKVSDMMLH